MRPYFGEQFGNASSIHHHGQETRAAVERARESVAALLGCRPSEIVFTSGGTEGDNLAISGLAARRRPRNHFDHRASCRAELVQASGSDGMRSHLRSRGWPGLVDPDDVRRALRPNTRLITIMMANNETGVLQPVEEIGKIAAEADVYFHTDAVQAAGKVPIEVKRHRLRPAVHLRAQDCTRPQGVGALYVRKGTVLQPLFYGGSHERSRRAGTENVPGIVGLGKAAEIAQSRRCERGDLAQMSALRDRLRADNSCAK